MGNKGSCKAEGCEQDVHAKGYCDRHYRKWRKGLLGKPRRRSCNEKGCGKPQSRRGLCAEHFAERRKKKSKAEAPAAEATA
jgi:hypothetical protein